MQEIIQMMTRLSSILIIMNDTTIQINVHVNECFLLRKRLVEILQFLCFQTNENKEFYKLG